MTIPTAVLEALLRDRPAPAHERIKRTVTATRISGGWSCVWGGADGLGYGTQTVTDEEAGAACPHCGGGPVLSTGCQEESSLNYPAEVTR